LRSTRISRTVPPVTSKKPVDRLPAWNKVCPATSLRSTAAARTVDESQSAALMGRLGMIAIIRRTAATR
jgi:hypothetical protein